jgi:hypothetical protein
MPGQLKIGYTRYLSGFFFKINCSLGVGENLTLFKILAQFKW